jgi:hypothetical protein
MAHQHPDCEARRLPTMVLPGIRDGSYRVAADVDVEKIRILSRIVMRADAAGFDVMPLLPCYAAQVDSAMDRANLNSDWTETMKAVHEIVWPFNASSYSLSSTFWADAGRPRDLDGYIAAFKAWVAEREEEQACSPSQADQEIRAEMERVKALFPRVGLSYGYIGNIWHAPYRDDRSFRIFTQVQHLDDRIGQTMGMGDHSHENLSKLRTMVLAKLEDWARDLDARLEARTLKLRSTRHLEALAA